MRDKIYRVEKILQGEALAPWAARVVVQFEVEAALSFSI
jgi:hypothetical protein